MDKKKTKKKTARKPDAQPSSTIYHCEHRHRSSECFGADAKKKKLWVQAVKHAENHKIKVREFLISPLEHRIFLILESPSFEAIENAFGSVKGLGDMVVTPVLKGSYLEG